jgi:hypothetical protein
MPDTDPDEFDFSCDRSIAALRQVADHRRAELLARNIHASLQGENKANALLALVQVLGVWLSSEPLERQITGLAVISRLITQQLLGDDDDHAA